MRVLFLGPGHNGIARGRVAPFLEDEGLEALWISTEPFPPAFLERYPRLRVAVLPRARLRGSRLARRLFLHTADYLAEVGWTLRRFRPDVIHVHYLSQLDALALQGVRRVPIVVTVMGADVLAEQVPRPLPLDLAVRRILRRAAAVTAKSRFLAQACRDLGARNVLHLPWGIDTARFQPAAREEAQRALGLDPARRWLVSCRALQPLYNHAPLLEALGELEDPPALAFVRHAPAPDYAERLERRAVALGLSARWLPPQSNAAMPQLYAAADLVASLPASDGLPQTLLEAMACERATLSLDLEAYRELPFAPAALTRVAHREGEPDHGALVAGLREALAPQPERDEALAAARQWVRENAELSESVARVRALYRSLS
ncbi:MAG TPA: hypothetical protein DEA08_37375 [Planctomycetes bacterium]|nr:hypothetical protein [Planctomycetota bacterium]